MLVLQSIIASEPLRRQLSFANHCKTPIGKSRRTPEMSGNFNHLACPICLDFPEDIVYQCRNGHVICEPCSIGITTCPQCRVPFEGNKIRNRVAESLLGDIKMPCPNRQSGCDLVMPRKELRAHERNCVHRLQSLCKLINFKDCTFTSSDPIQLFNHIREFHQVRKFEATSNKGMITFKDFGTYTNQPYDKTGCTLWEVQSHERSLSRLALFTAIDTAKDDYVFVCLYLGQCPSEVTQHLVEISIRDSFKQTMKWKWIGEPIYYKDAEEHIKHPPFRIPLRYLQTHVGGDSEMDLVWEIAVTKKFPVHGFGVF